MTTSRAQARGSSSVPRRWSGVVATIAVAGAMLTGCAPNAGAPPVVAVASTAASSPSLSTTPSPTPSPTPSGPALATPMPASAPVRLVVPAIGVDSELMALGLEADGTMQVPPGAVPAGWYTGAPTPGERGPAVIAGHVNWAGRRGVFHDLAAMVVGDTITVVRADGSVATFSVVDVREYPKSEFPTDAVYGDTAGPELRLITCGGDFNRAIGHYVDNIVVYAVLEPAALRY